MIPEITQQRERVSLQGYVRYLETVIVPSTRKKSEVYGLLKSAVDAQGMRKILAAAAAHNHAIHGQLTPRFLCSHDCRGKGILLPAENQNGGIV